jgi:hypothetical protein
MKHAFTVAAAGLAAFSLGACMSMDNPELVQPGQPVSAIVVANATDEPVVEILIGRCEDRFMGSPDYGFDRLEGRLRPGESRSFPASPGCYNLRALVGGGLILGPGERFMTVNVGADQPAVWEIQQP